MDHEYKLRKELDNIEGDVAQNRADINILMKRPYIRYGKVLRLLDDGTCDVREVESNKVYYNVPILNGVNLERYTVVVIGFMNNSFLNPFIIGGLDVTSVLDGLVEYVDDIVYDVEQKLGLTLTSTQNNDGSYDLNSILTFDNEAYPTKQLDLWLDGNIIDSQITDTNGAVTFNIVVIGEQTFAVKYKDILSKSITLIANYVLSVEHSTIETSTGDATINATLLMNSFPVTNKTITLYNETTLIDTETTNNDGEVSFNVTITEDTTFTLKYNDITATVEIIITAQEYTWKLDGTDGENIGNISTIDGLMTNTQAGYILGSPIDNTKDWIITLDFKSEPYGNDAPRVMLTAGGDVRYVRDNSFELRSAGAITQIGVNAEYIQSNSHLPGIIWNGWETYTFTKNGNTVTCKPTHSSYGISVTHPNFQSLTVLYLGLDGDNIGYIRNASIEYI